MAAPVTKESPAKGLNKISERQLKSISDRLKNDISKQLLVLDFLDNMDAEASGHRSKRASKPKENKREETDSSLDSDAHGFYIPPATQLNKHAMKYSGWRKSLCVELLSYVEPRMFSPTKKANIDSVQVAKQLIEFGFCLVVMDEKSSDRPQTSNKLEAFERLRKLYGTLGKRFRALTLSTGKGFLVDWCSQGVDEVEEIQEGGARIVELRGKFADKSARAPAEHIRECEPGYFTNDRLQNNWSGPSAFLEFPGGSALECHTLFPKIKRALKRKISDVCGAAVPREGEEVSDAIDGKDDVGWKKRSRVAAARLAPQPPVGAADSSGKPDVTNPQDLAAAGKGKDSNAKGGRGAPGKTSAASFAAVAPPAPKDIMAQAARTMVKRIRGKTSVGGEEAASDDDAAAEDAEKTPEGAVEADNPEGAS